MFEQDLSAAAGCSGRVGGRGEKQRGLGGEETDWNGWSGEKGVEGGFWARAGIRLTTGHVKWDRRARTGWLGDSVPRRQQEGSGAPGCACPPCLLNTRVSLESGEMGEGGGDGVRGLAQLDKTRNMELVDFPG